MASVYLDRTIFCSLKILRASKGHIRGVSPIFFDSHRRSSYGQNKTFFEGNFSKGGF